MDSQFYVSDMHKFNDDFYAYGEQLYDEINQGAAEKCTTCKGTTSLLKWLPPYDIRLSKKKIGDFIFGSYINPIVSERFVKLYKSEGLTGIKSFHKASLYYRKKEISENYFHAEIEGIYAFLDQKKMVFDFRADCPECQIGHSELRSIDGVSFLKPDKIKLDIFFNQCLGYSQFFMSIKLVNLIKKHQITNINCTPSESFVMDLYNFGKNSCHQYYQNV